MAKKTTSKPAAMGERARLPVAPKTPPVGTVGRGGTARVPVWSDFPEDLSDLPALASELVRINKEKAALEAEADTYRLAIRELMAGVNNKTSWSTRDEGTDWVATYVVPKPGKKLVPELLIKAGVSTKQLAKGYKEIPAKKPYVQVRTKGEDIGSNEEHE